MRQVLKAGYGLLSGRAVGIAVAIGMNLVLGFPLGKAAASRPGRKEPARGYSGLSGFIDYTSPQGFTMKVPEGWARSDRTDGTSFVDKLDGVVVSVTRADNPPTVSSVKITTHLCFERSGGAVKIGSIKPVKLPAGQAIRITYTSNSEPNQVPTRCIWRMSAIYISRMASSLRLNSMHPRALTTSTSGN